MSLRDKMLAVMADVNTSVAEREELVELIAIALLTRKNLFILGDPGQAKSYAINAFRSRITGAKQFERLLSKQTDEEQLFGRLDLSSLIPGSVPESVFEGDSIYQNLRFDLQSFLNGLPKMKNEAATFEKLAEISGKLDAYRKAVAALHPCEPVVQTAGKIPEADIVFLDEIFKCNDGVLNALLTALNERKYPYAQVRCPDEFSWTVRNVRTGDELTTTIRIVNSGEHSYFTNIGTIGITFPMPDKYDAANICLNDRCHTHIFCGENTSYVMCLRMGGEAPHLGMVLTEGSLSGYSVERDIARMSNDRGCFLLHPSPKEFAPGEEMKITWKLFPHNGKEDFYRKLRAYPSIIGVEAKHFLLFAGEQEKIQIVPAFPAKEVTVNGTAIRKDGNGEWQYVFKADRLGEQILRIEADGVQTVCRLLVQQPVEELLENRCRFIVKNQQYHGQIRELQGAYLGFDNEEKHLVYTPENDFNAGRERTGMGVLLAHFLQMNGTPAHKEEEESLKAYRAYYLRELVDPDTGVVCNDAGRDNHYFRLYNYPWAATFFVECYNLWKNPQDLKIAQKIVNKFYELGGCRFYPIEMPIVSICSALEDAGWTEDAATMKRIFRNHADTLIAAGKNYPASEVKFEQSIIAPAADVILQVYELSGEEKYLDGARLQMEMLDLFNGEQPDYHLHEAAIRHWDGYWFGKRRLYGDTFPHYWSAETGRVFRRYAALTGDTRYLEKAENSLRGVLSMFYPDGTATCAYVFPYSVNGERADLADPYANDQDWGLCSFIEKTR